MRPCVAVSQLALLLSCAELFQLSRGGESSGDNDGEKHPKGAGKVKCKKGDKKCKEDDDGKQAAFVEPKTWGEPGFWLKLETMEASEGEIEPPFKPDINKYTLEVGDAHLEEMTFTLVLDLDKYDLLYPPRITIDGKELDYNPQNAIEVVIPLNESVGALDKTVAFAVEDPKGMVDTFSPYRLVGAHSARNVYYVEITQPPNFDGVVSARKILVKDPDGHEIESMPRFDTRSPQVDYLFPFRDKQTSASVQVQCHDQATGVTYDGEPASPWDVKEVKVSGALTTMLVQCLYENEKWTKGVEFQKTYVLSFSRDDDLNHTDIDLTMFPSQGFCEREIKDGVPGFACRSVDEMASVAAVYNNSLATAELVQNAGGSKMRHRMENGHPVDLHFPKKPLVVELVLEAGHNVRRFPVTMQRPAVCKGNLKCPSGWVVKPRADENVGDRVCASDPCTKKDVPRCCDKGSAFDVDLVSWSGKKQDIIDILKKVIGVSAKKAKYLTEHTPTTLGQGIPIEEAKPLESELVAHGAAVRTVRSKYSFFNVTLVDVGPNKAQVLDALASDVRLDQEKIKEVVDKARSGHPAFIKTRLNGKKAQKLQLLLEAKGAKIGILGERKKFSVVVKTLSGDIKQFDKLPKSQQQKLINEVTHVGGISKKEAAKKLQHLPAVIAKLQEKECVAAAQKLSFAGASAEYEEVSGAACDTMKCPKGMTLSSNAASVNCKEDPCTKQDVFKCCGIETHCSRFHCPLHYGHKLTPAGTKCVGEECVATCCSPVSMCSSFTCPIGYEKKAEAWRISCWDSSCKRFGLQLCCNEIPVCSRFTDIAFGYVLKRNAANISVDPLTREACTDPRAKCSSYTCPAGLVLKIHAELLMCAKQDCSKIDDETCCAASGSCFAYKCPAHFAQKPEPHTISCKSQVCTSKDAPSCCERKATCGGFKCPPQYVLRRDAKMIECKRGKCSGSDVPFCCEKVATCTPEICSRTFGPKKDWYHHFCAGPKCTKEDEGKCCQKRVICNKLKLQRGFKLKDKYWGKWVDAWDKDNCFERLATCASFGRCPGGFNPKPHSDDIYCRAAECSDADTGACCHKPRERNATSMEEQLEVNVVPGQGQGVCKPSRDGFWCLANEAQISLSIVYLRDGKEQKRTDLAPIDAPEEGAGVKHVSVVVRHQSLEKATLNIWVAHRSGHHWARQAAEPVIDRRLRSSEGAQRVFEVLI